MRRGARRDQQLQRQRPAEVARVQRADGGQRAAGAVAADREARQIDAERLRFGARMWAWLPWWLPLLVAALHMAVLVIPVVRARRRTSQAELRRRFGRVRTLAQMFALEPEEFTFRYHLALHLGQLDRLGGVRQVAARTRRGWPGGGGPESGQRFSSSLLA